MHNLPSELLFSIFEASTRLEEASKENFCHHQPVILSHVCSKWRSIALADPSLWTNITIDGTSPIYRLYLQRSRPKLVDLTIMCTSRSRGRVVAFAQAELPHPDVQADLQRVQSSHIVAWSDAELDQLAQIMDMHNFPHLVSLHAEVNASQNVRPLTLQWWSHQHSHSPILPTHTPKLATITLVNRCTNCLGETTSLTRLELRELPGPFDCTVLEKITQSSPRLDTLVLSEMDFLWHRQQEPKSQKTAGQSQIKSLSIASSTFSKKRATGIERRCYCLLRNLVEGGLERLEIVGGHQEAFCHLIPSIKNRRLESGILQLILHQVRPCMLDLALGLPRDIVHVEVSQD
ncbi:hypothetical protein NMY22_g7470 [Coprinellus aureogranulatus]|nr:hypothetical protein NMY22_g7470 [Coprinellus aureogranulatus]